MTCADTVQGVDAHDLEMVANGRGSRFVYLLVGRRGLSVKDMAKLCACSERHVYRLADSATLAGVPVTVTDGWVELWLDGRDY